MLNVNLAGTAWPGGACAAQGAYNFVTRPKTDLGVNYFSAPLKFIDTPGSLVSTFFFLGGEWDLGANICGRQKW